MVPRLGSPVEKLTRRMFTRIITAVARMLREQELSVGQVAVLYLLDEREAFRISDVSTELDISLPTASRMVDDLVRQSLVGRREDPNDRRARTLSLTPEGRDFIARSSKARMATIASATSDVPASAVKAVWSLGKPK